MWLGDRRACKTYWCTKKRKSKVVTKQETVSKHLEDEEMFNDEEPDLSHSLEEYIVDPNLILVKKVIKKMVWKFFLIVMESLL